MGDPGLRFVGISTVSAPTSEPGVGRRVWRTPSSQQLPDRGLGTAGIEGSFPVVGWDAASSVFCTPWGGSVI